MAKLILADGTELEGLQLNGSNVVSKKKINEKIFEGNLSTLKIVDEDGKEITLKDAELIQQEKYGTEWYLAFYQPTEEERKNADIKEALELADQSIAELTMMLASLMGGMTA